MDDIKNEKWMICVNNGSCESLRPVEDELTMNKKYKMLNSDSSCGVNVINDKGNDKNYLTARFIPAGSDQKEEWVMTREGSRYMVAGQWYKITKWDGDRFYFMTNGREEQYYYDCEDFQFSSTPPSEDKKVIVGYKHKSLDYEAQLIKFEGEENTRVMIRNAEYVFPNWLLGKDFSPVYAPEKPVEEVITLNMIDFKICVGRILIRNCTRWVVSDIKEWIAFDKKLGELEELSIGGHSAKDIRMDFQGLAFSRSDGQKIISIYQKLNS